MLWLSGVGKMVRLIQEYFMKSAQLFPNQVAVNFKEENITYTELHAYSNKLAHFLIHIGIQQNSRIAFCLHKSLHSIKSVLGILKADCCYVPLDPHSPPERLQQIVEDCSPAVVLCDTATLDHTLSILQRRNGDSPLPKLIVLSPQDFNTKRYQKEHQGELYTEEAVLQQPETPRPFENKGSDLAYIIYTSGSTGKPKGVMITHANVISFIEWVVPKFHIAREDILSNHAPMHFDLSTFDMYSTFKSGARLVLVPPELNSFPERLVQFMEQKEISVWMSVPSILTYIAKVDILNPTRIPQLRLIIPTGEVFPTPFLAQWMNLFPQKTFVNMFGPTETTVECTYYIIDKVPTDLSLNIPIGKACDHLEVFALKEDGTIAGVGELGELYVRGLSVSPGYWNNQQKTEEHFVKNPLFSNLNDKVYWSGDLVQLQEDGNYLFKGRKDHQIKYMGHRIELGEIEAALQSLPTVREAIVIFSKIHEAGKLVAYVALSKSMDHAQIQEELSTLLPKYMIPEIKIVEKLPRTTTGKIDRMKVNEDYEKTNFNNR